MMKRFKATHSTIRFNHDMCAINEGDLYQSDNSLCTEADHNVNKDVKKSVIDQINLGGCLAFNSITQLNHSLLKFCSFDQEKAFHLSGYIP